ncbi:MAG: hypothetical protein ORN26_02135 [Candidatus Pacebacteria bacterium]|nr:hypothetical protein [Candidatus Paceibacterota bacterium]
MNILTGTTIKNLLKRDNPPPIYPPLLSPQYSTTNKSSIAPNIPPIKKVNTGIHVCFLDIKSKTAHSPPKYLAIHQDRIIETKTEKYINKPPILNNFFSSSLSIPFVRTASSPSIVFWTDFFFQIPFLLIQAINGCASIIAITKVKMDSKNTLTIIIFISDISNI